MSNRKLAQALQKLTREIQRLHRKLNRALVNWLLRSAFVAYGRGRSPVAGFVLPTTVLLLLVVTVAVGAMTLRAFDRNIQVIANTQQKVIYNAATPAIDRARSKLEFLFDRTKDPRYPGGTPYEGQLLGMMLNDGSQNQGFTVPVLANDPYTLPDETRMDIGGPNGTNADNAWWFRTDTDGNGTPDATVVYAITFRTPAPSADNDVRQQLLTLTDAQKATQQVVRSAPVSQQSRLTGCGGGTGQGAADVSREAWFQDTANSSIVRKPFQVDAMVIPDNPKAAATTLEFQQDRQLQRGNKWGAWFRYDLEIFPGPQFNWNGAMHTEGNLILGDPSGGTSFNAYLVSSPNSCLFQQDSSELSITQAPDTQPDGFRGQVVMGLVGRDPLRGGTARVHVQQGETGHVVREIVEATDGSTAVRVADVASNPVSIVLQETTTWVNPIANATTAAAGWAKLKADNPDVDAGVSPDLDLPGRIINKREDVPYVDDLYRADDRYGPKPKYDNNADGSIPAGMRSGDAIPTGSRLIQSEAGAGAVPNGNTTSVGLDGYWERRARLEGMRILVGQRLELGNLSGWETPRDVSGDGYIQWPSAPSLTNLINKNTPNLERAGDPLYPPTVQPYPVANNGVQIPHLTQQRRALRDNLPAVQSAAVYHSAVGNKDYPVACLAMTSHPGTVHTLRQSVNFFPTSFFQTDEVGTRAAGLPGILLTNFFTGQGTNGWEFQPPAGDVATFTAQLAADQPLRVALENLASFAGDPKGAFPATQEAGLIHPHPALTMWGDFSNLRRALRDLDTKGYANLSVADKTYLQTASCTLGMLAYNIEQLRRFDPTDSRNDFEWNRNSRKVLTLLGLRLAELMDGSVDNGEVLPKSQLSTYNYDAGGAFDSRTYNPRDYDNVPPEAYIAALKQQVFQSLNNDYLNDPVIRMAELIMLQFQIRRDRTFGFRPSPIFGEYAIAGETVDAQQVRVFPAACDPDLFALNDPTSAPDSQVVNGLRVDGAPTSVSMTRPGGGVGTLTVKQFPTTYTDPQQFPGAMSSGGFTSLAGARLGLSRLCGAIQVPPNYDPARATPPNYAVGANNEFHPTRRPVVLPKFPALYYLFPEEEHGLRGALVERRGGNENAPNGIADRLINPQRTEYDHRQPGAIGSNGTTAGTYTTGNEDATRYGFNVADRESYVVDGYINDATVNGSFTFRPIPDALPANQKDGRLQAYPPYLANDLNPVSLATRAAGLPTDQIAFSRYPYIGSNVFPIDDLSLAAIVLQPRAMNGFPANTEAAVLPNYTPLNGDPTTSTNISSNRIRIPSTSIVATARVTTLSAMPTREWAVPLLDRVMFDGRELQPARVTDIDLGMLRSTKPANQTTGNTTFAPNDFWLPMSGIVYAFREDAVREDAIARPAGGPANVANITNALLTPGAASDARFPASTFDPMVPPNGISVKPIDYLPDPRRRVHGFRLMNGAQIKRNPALLGSLDPATNVRGLSFFTDQPVYIYGDFNLHQQGTGNEPGFGGLLEEFNEQIFPDTATANYDEAMFYDRRVTRNTDFATLDNDRWRSTEILADSVSILSNTFCDGSLADTFLGIPRNQYTQFGLYAPACTDTIPTTSFRNQNVPIDAPPTAWDWQRESAGFVVIQGQTDPISDFTAPVKISRTGEPLLLARPVTGTRANVSNPVPVPYGLGGLTQRYNEVNSDDRDLMEARTTRVNAIVVSGIPPSRDGQSYGGLHNFPRFLQRWGDSRLFFAGSFLQLNFSNYATGPFEQEGWEPGQGPDAVNENLTYYRPPNRLWGYDVALQFAPAGPAATRFITPATKRNEFYTELPVNDPYINQLCQGARRVPSIPTTARLNCPA
jgi:hypothetical protein